MPQNKGYTYLLRCLWLLILYVPVKAAAYMDAKPKVIPQIVTMPSRQSLPYSTKVNRVVYGWVRKESRRTWLGHDIIKLIIAFYPSKIIVFVGPPGAGSSTAIFALQGNTVTCQRDHTGHPKILRGKPLPHIKVPIIGDAVTLGTLGPITYDHPDPTKKIAFCDTRAFLAIETPKKLSKYTTGYTPFFAPKRYNIGGIAWVVQAEDILYARGYMLKTSAHSLYQQYFNFVKNSALRKSILLLITHGSEHQWETLCALLQIIQESYKQYFSLLKKKRRYARLPAQYRASTVTKNLGALKPFWRMLLAQEVYKGEEHDIRNFYLDDSRILFFDPSNAEDVNNTLAQLEKLAPLTTASSGIKNLSCTCTSRYKGDTKWSGYRKINFTTPSADD